MNETLAQQYKCGTLNKFGCTVGLAIILAALHFTFVAIPLIMSGGTGESQAFLVVCADMPLYLLLKTVMGSSMYSVSRLHHVLIYSIGGTLMYAIFGALMGLLFDRMSRKSRSGSM